MGNDLQKQYNLKEKPIKLPGSYSFLKYVDHPTDSTSSLIIVKEPHKVGIVSSQILLPIKDVKNLGYSDYTVATCRKCKPLSMVKPRSESQTKLIITQIIKLGCEIGRIFICDGRLMLWCEEIRSQWFKSPEEIQQGRQSDKSKVFWAGICLINYLNFVYQKDVDKKKRQKKAEFQAFFDPKDRKQYYEFIDNLEYKLSRSNFWSAISQGMKNLILVMLTKQLNQRIDLATLMLLPYFATQKQLKLYHMISDEMLEWDQKQSIIVMQTLEMVIKDRIIFDELVLNEYLAPVLAFLLQKKPEMIISAIVELPNPPTKNIIVAIKKANPKNGRFFNSVILKAQKIQQILTEQEFDSVMSRAAFCSFELHFLLQKLIKILPFLIKYIKEPNYKKQIELQLLKTVILNNNIQKNLLLTGLKCVIQLLTSDLISNVNKLYDVKFDPWKYDQDLQVNLHVLQMYRLMILHMQPLKLVSVMMPKLDPYLSAEELTDELFLNAKRLVSLIMSRLVEARNMNEEDEIQVKYDSQFFALTPNQKPTPAEMIPVLKKQAAKSKNPNIVWLTDILEKQEPLTQF